MRSRIVVKDLFVLWIALAALGCAAVNLHISLNMIVFYVYLVLTSTIVVNSLSDKLSFWQC